MYYSGRDRMGIQECIRRHQLKKNLLKITGALVVLILLTVITFKGINSFTQFKEQKRNIVISLQEEVDNLNNKLTEKEKELSTLSEENSNLKEENNNLNDSLKTKEEELETLQSKATVTSRSSTTVTRTESSSEWITGNISAYCSCTLCCGSYANGITASGAKATAGRTIAAPSTYAFGTKIEIEGYGIYVVEDRGGAINGNRLDVYMNSHSEALNFGRKQIRFRVVE
jgi:3D (Asp-Asp-Asp) domain-containing protein